MSNSKQFKYIFILFHLFTNIPFAHSQITVNEEINIPFDENTDAEVELLPLKEDGFAVLVDKNKYIDRKKTILVMKYDSTFQQKWSLHFQYENTFSYKHNFLNQTHLYLYIENNENQLFRIVRIDLQTGENVTYDAQLLTRLNVNQFKIIGSKAIIGGDYNDRAIVELFNFVDKTNKIIPAVYSNFLQITDIEVVNSSNTFLVLIKNSKKCQFSINEYSYEGKLISTKIIGDRSHIPLSGKILSIDSNKNFLVGNYSDNCTEYTVGYFVYDITEGSSPHFYKFTELSNYLNYLSDKRKNRVLSKIDSKKEKGKEYKIRQRLLLHELQPTANGWLMVGEVYYPEYQPPTQYSYYSSYRYVRTGKQIYNKFTYSHAFIAEFNNQGELIWNNSVNLKRTSATTLNELTQVTFDGEDFVVAYPEEERILTLKIDRNHATSQLKAFNLKALSSTKSLENYTSNLLAWHSHTFIAHGFKKILLEDQLKPIEIYQITKIKYDVNAP